MSSNGTLSSTGGGSSSDEVTLRLTYAAIGLSVGAIFLSTLQALLAYLQFDISEIGSRRCSKEVMGMWASKTRRKFDWRSLRFQVFFEVPVLYTAPPNVTVGPLNKMKPKATFRERFIAHREGSQDRGNYKTFQEKAKSMEVIEIQEHIETIYKITGTEVSCRNTLTPMKELGQKWASSRSLEYETCSWTLLLDTLQNQEKTSRAWDNTYKLDAIPGSGHTICYLIQKRMGRWHLMPPEVTKPFAITNMCFLVEIMSMLGLIWTDFDMKRSTLRAQGNGFLVSSEHVAGLGVMVRFSQMERPRYQENRVVPCIELKKICFGEVPSILDSRREVVQLSPKLLGTSLKRILPQLDERQLRQFLEPLQPTLMLPSIFELIAMIARSFHLPGSRFRRLPNPCATSWTTGFDFASCLTHFATAFKNSTSLGSHPLVEQLQSILFRNGLQRSVMLSGDQTLTQKLRSYSKSKKQFEEHGSMFWPGDNGGAMKEELKAQFDKDFLDLLDSLHYVIEYVDGNLLDKFLVQTGRAVKKVMALHFAALSDHQEELNGQLAECSLEDPEEKILINFYFDKIHPEVVARVQEDEGDGVNTPGWSVNEKSAIWVALVFRMLAWLVLHDFDPEDTMIERSEFMNSRLPVYIG